MKNELFEKIKIKNSILENRFVFSPISLNLARNNKTNKKEIDFIVRRSKSAPMIITGGLYVNKYGSLFENGISICDDKDILHLKKYSAAIKKNNSLAIAQLIHAGQYSHASLKKFGYTYGPSYQKLNYPFEHEVKQLTKKQIENIILDYRNATRRAILSNFDGIEISSAQKLLPQQFFSSFLNKRKDEYSCENLENRSRFLIEIFENVIDEIKKSKNKNFILGYRATAEEQRGIELGYKIDDFISFLNLFFSKNLKFDYLAIASWGENVFENKVRSETFFNENIIEVLKKTINKDIPIIINGSINSIEKIIKAKKYADLIGISSLFVSDPELVYKIKNNLPINLEINKENMKSLAISKKAFNNIFHYFSFSKSLSQKTLDFVKKNSEG